MSVVRIGPEVGSSPRERGARAATEKDRSTSGLIPARAGSTFSARTRAARVPAHPRASGEHGRSVSEVFRNTGSSPRERGARRQDGRRRAIGRLIPARAGSTHEPRRSREGYPAHPRASGEHVVLGATLVHVGGSSPRERGARRASGSTPTASAAHPRASGEHSGSGWTVHVESGSSPRERGAPLEEFLPRAAVSGSSPRERGAPLDAVRSLVAVRLIPARAGSTQPIPDEAFDEPAHPRASGEHCISELIRLKYFGSSPRERGARGSSVGPAASSRLIPARAGSTWSRLLPCLPTTAHPRASGEHKQLIAAGTPLFGSSPRERGARSVGDDRPGQGRLIPARAGSTRVDLVPRLRSPAHPRASGEHSVPGGIDIARYGSSPRERGAQAEPSRVPRRVRLIPARAGSTT